MKSLYKKYRPSNLDKVYGNEETVNSLKENIKNNAIPQVILFHGPTGSGKTTLARILANELKAKENLTEINSANFNGIDTIRELTRKSRFIPIGGGSKVYIIDECHRLSSQAQDAFLKDLEDTPKHVYYFLCTTNPEKLIAPLKGRCIQYQVQTLEDSDMTSLLKYVVKKEKDKVDKKVYKTIVSNSKGHPRNALNILQQVLSVSDKKRLKIAENFELEENQSIELCRAMLQQKGWKEVQEILKGLKGQDAEGIRRVVLGYCQSVLLGNDWKGSHQKAAQIMEEFLEPTYNSGFPQIVIACYAYYHSD